MPHASDSPAYGLSDSADSCIAELCMIPTLSDAICPFQRGTPLGAPAGSYALGVPQLAQTGLFSRAHAAGEGSPPLTPTLGPPDVCMAHAVMRRMRRAERAKPDLPLDFFHVAEFLASVLFYRA
jgi:hypothetical protein